MAAGGAGGAGGASGAGGYGMTLAIAYKLLAIFFTVALGWLAAWQGWLGKAGGGSDPARVLGNAAFFLFVPALLFRTMARLDLAALPWRTLAAYFVPVLALLLAFFVTGYGVSGRYGMGAWFDEKGYYEFFPLHAVYENKNERFKYDM